MTDTTDTSTTGTEITYYIYTVLNSAAKTGYYAGQSVTQDASLPAPANSTPIVPMTVSVQTNYWIGDRWIVGPLFSSITDANWITAYQNAQATIFAYNMDLLKTPYTAAEASTWARQEQDARAFVAAGASAVATPFLQALATARGQAVQDLATSIVTKSNAYALQQAQVLGTYQALKTDQVTADTARNWCYDFLLNAISSLPKIPIVH